MKQYLWLYISYQQDDWAEWSPMAEFAYNIWQHLSTGRSPFLVNLRRYPNIFGKSKESTQKVQEVDEFIQKIKEVRKEVEESLKKTNEMMKRRTDKSRGEAIKYKEGNLVWVDSSNISSDQHQFWSPG